MSSDMYSNDVLTVKNENSLPSGWKLISDKDGDLPLNDRQRKEIIVFDVSRDDSQKIVWILSVRSAYQGVMFMQISKRAQDLGYKVSKDGVIDPALLSLLYARKNNLESQQKQKNNSSIILEFERMMSDALKNNVSDIHILVRANGTTFNVRKNGEYQPYGDEVRSLEDGLNLCSVMYTVLANVKSTNFDARLFQAAAIDYTLGEQDFKLRYQSLPAYPDGFDVVLRVLPIGRSEEFTPLVKLGYTDQQNEDFWSIGSCPEGALIIAGVTGSGKSTTSKNLLMSINAEAGYKIKCYTIEDPPEYNIARVTQIPVIAASDTGDHTKKESPFAMPIKACMRADPDIIMIGEVRDHVTGDLTKKAVQSGHQVITTVHATSAVGIIERLIDFGLTRSTLGSPDFLSGLVYQKLLGIVCPSCSFNFVDLVRSSSVTKKEIGIYKRISKHVDVEKFNIRVRNHKGCSNCSGGLIGRTVCAEIIVVDYNIIKLIASKDSIDLIRYWRSLSDNNPASTNMRGKTCMEHGFQKMLMGVCCPFEVESSFRSIDNMKMIEVDIDTVLTATKTNAQIETTSSYGSDSESSTEVPEIDVDRDDFTLDDN